jgi:hypothetical protein
MVQQDFETLPVEAAALVSSVQPLQQNLHRSSVELLNPDSIPFHSVVVVIRKLPVQFREKHRNGENGFSGQRKQLNQIPKIESGFKATALRLRTNIDPSV